MVSSYSKLFYVCQCDKCNRKVVLEKDLDLKIYNRAQAVRFLGWSFSKDCKIKCDFCRRRYVTYKGFCWFRSGIVKLLLYYCSIVVIGITTLYKKYPLERVFFKMK